VECWELKKWVLNDVERKTIGDGLIVLDLEESVSVRDETVKKTFDMSYNTGRIKPSKENNLLKNHKS